MEFINILIAIGTALGSIYTLKKLFFEKIEKQFEKIDASLKEIRSDIHKIDKRIIRIEDRLEFSNKIVYVQHEELKEN